MDQTRKDGAPAAETGTGMHRQQILWHRTELEEAI